MFLMLILYMVVQVDPCLRFPSDLEMKMCGGGRGYFVVKVRCGRFSVKVAKVEEDVTFICNCFDLPPPPPSV